MWATCEKPLVCLRGSCVKADGRWWDAHGISAARMGPDLLSAALQEAFFGRFSPVFGRFRSFSTVRRRFFGRSNCFGGVSRPESHPYKGPFGSRVAGLSGQGLWCVMAMSDLTHAPLSESYGYNFLNGLGLEAT